MQSSSTTKKSSSRSLFRLTLNDDRYRGNSCSNSDQDYSAKVSDFEAADSGSTNRSQVLSGGGREGDYSSRGSDFSAQVSGQLSSLESEESETDPETASYSEFESECSSRQSDTNMPTDSGVFLTQGKYADEKLKPSRITSELSLIQATKDGAVSLVKQWIAKGSNLDAVDLNCRTALHVACSLGRLEIMQNLIEGGANVDASSVAGQTPLHEACINGRYTVLQEMLSEVADLDTVDINGLSAAHYCAMNGEVKCLSLLCSQVRL